MTTTVMTGIMRNLLTTGKNIVQNVVAKTRFRRLPGAENKITPKPDVSSVQKIGKRVVPQNGSFVERGFPDICFKASQRLLRSRNLAQELHNKYGRYLGPSFAFGFAGLAFHSKLETEQSQDENLSAEVRKIFNHREGKHSLLEHVQELMSLDDFGIGQLIGQGCNAAVYEAKINTPLEKTASDVTLDTDAESGIVVLNSDAETDSCHGDEALVAEDAAIGFTSDTDAESDIVVLNSDGDTDSCRGDEALVDSFVMVKEERYLTIRENMTDDNSSTVSDDLEETFENAPPDTDAESDIVVLNSDGDTDSCHGDEALVAEDAAIGFSLDTDAESDIVVLNSDGDTDSCHGDEALVDSFVMIKEERYLTIRENMTDDNSSTVSDDLEETFEYAPPDTDAESDIVVLNSDGDTDSCHGDEALVAEDAIGFSLDTDAESDIVVLNSDGDTDSCHGDEALVDSFVMIKEERYLTIRENMTDDNSSTVSDDLEETFEYAPPDTDAESDIVVLNSDGDTDSCHGDEALVAEDAAIGFSLDTDAESDIVVLNSDGDTDSCHGDEALVDSFVMIKEERYLTIRENMTDDNSSTVSDDLEETFEYEETASDVTLDSDAESGIVVLNSDAETDSFHGDEALVAEDAVIGFTLDTDAESDIVVLNSDGDTDSCRGDEALVAEDAVIGFTEERSLTIRENMTDDDNSSTVSDDLEETFENDDVEVVEEYNLAIKMMYNYDVESNAEAIMRVMQKEALPAIMKAREDVWDDRSKVRLKSLPPHPNIVEMLGVFVDPVPVLPGALSQYPAALPKRLNPSGFGRNKTMFIVMKKYTGGTLRDYLTNEEPSLRTRCLLLAQLLEGVGHLQRHGVAHRDLKSDNIFIGNTNGCGAPQLVIGDFGCCLAEVDNDLTLAYTTAEMDRGGNPALMPPEIKCAVPGKNVVLDYKKYDIFTVGSLVYEIFGCENPFYKKTDGEMKLNSRYYDEADLPSLPDDVPGVIKFLTGKILSRDPRQRPSPTLAANLLHIYLFFPEWLLPENKPVYKTVKKAIILMTAELIFIQRHRGQSSQTVDNQLKRTFLAKLDISKIVNCIEMFHSNL